MRKILADVAEKDIFESVTITVNYKDGYSRVDTVYLKGGERLVLESGPDPVEKIKARIAEVTADLMAEENAELHKEVERLTQDDGAGVEIALLRSRLEKAEKDTEWAMKRMHYAHEERGKAEARVRELEAEQNETWESLYRGSCAKNIVLTARIGFLIAAGDDLRWQVAEFTKAMGLKESDAPRINAWDKAKGEAVPYNDGAR